MNISLPLITLAAALALPASIAAQGTRPPVDWSSGGSAAPGTPAEHARLVRVSEALNAGLAAERKGDYDAAEDKYKEAVEASKDPLLRIRLARLYDKMGRDRDALAQYRAVVRYQGRGSSTDQDDPRTLARYGDLCLQFKEPMEARTAYLAAAARTARRFSAAKRRTSPVTDPRDGTPSVVFAAAHLAAGLAAQFSEPEAFRKELAKSIQADPGYWAAHFYRAEEWAMHSALYPKEDPAKEAALAERLAPTSEAKAMVTELRRRARIPDLQGRYLPLLPVPRPNDRPEPGGTKR